MPRGRLVAFEGVEGCGKSTQAARFAERMRAHLTREPGGTPLGEVLRDVVLRRSDPDFDARAETMVMLAARAQHVAAVVGPILEQGRMVVTDRFSHSTLAYQGYGRGLDLADLRRMCSWVARGLWPDLVVLLDVPIEVGQARRLGPSDRLEAAGEEFHQRVRDGFLTLASEDPSGWVVVDGIGPVEDVAALVADGYQRWLGPAEPTRLPGWAQ